MVKSFRAMKYSFIVLITGIQLQVCPAGKRDEFFVVDVVNVAFC